MKNYICKIVLFLFIICFENLMEQQYDFTSSDLPSKLRSKCELYNLLTREGQLYIPPSKDCNQKFLRRILKGEKQYVSWKDVEVTKVSDSSNLLQLKQILIAIFLIQITKKNSI